MHSGSVTYLFRMCNTPVLPYVCRVFVYYVFSRFMCVPFSVFILMLLSYTSTLPNSSLDFFSNASRHHIFALWWWKNCQLSNDYETKPYTWVVNKKEIVRCLYQEKVKFWQYFILTKLFIRFAHYSVDCLFNVLLIYHHLNSDVIWQYALCDVT